MQYIVVWDNVAFHRSALTQNWFHQQPQFTVEYLPPHSPFLNPIEEFFSAWWKKVYEVLWPDAPHSSYGGSIHTRVDSHSKRFFPYCLAHKNIACDVDEALWTDFFFPSVLNWIKCFVKCSVLTDLSTQNKINIFISLHNWCHVVLVNLFLHSV